MNFFRLLLLRAKIIYNCGGHGCHGYKVDALNALNVGLMDEMRNEKISAISPPRLRIVGADE